MYKNQICFNIPGKNELTLKRGVYKFECWGASGGSRDIGSSSGAYVSGIISLQKKQKFFLFVGEKGALNRTRLSFNGGGAAAFTHLSDSYSHPGSDSSLSYSASGGGATDIRIEDGEWNDTKGLKSRIIVAAGGGGESNFVKIEVKPIKGNPAKGGNGGTISGEKGAYSLCNKCSPSSHTLAGGGQQTEGGNKGGGDSYSWGSEGTFGIGGSANTAINYWPSSGGGGGYFGGGSGGVTGNCLGSGAGGSSFVSGCSECHAVMENSTIDNIQFSGNIHYSGLSFRNIQMKEGSEVKRNSMDGEIRITYIDPVCIHTSYHKQSLLSFYLLSVFLSK